MMRNGSLPNVLRCAAAVLALLATASCQKTPVNLETPSAAALAAPAPDLSGVQPRADAPRPNIIVIVADDMGYGHLGVYGQKKIKTPRLDAMAAKGARFTDAYSGSTVCAPSRDALMTGRHTGKTTIKKNMGGVKPGGFLLPKDVTIAQVLKSVGYETAAIGKWGMGEPFTPGAPNKKGFDYFYGVTNQVDAHFHFPDYVLRNGERLEIAENAGGKRVLYGDDLYTEEALKFVAAPRENPFFLYLALVAPHAEMTVPEDSSAPYEGLFPETPYVNTEYKTDKTKNYADVARPKAAHAGIVSRLDASVGRILDALEAQGLAQNTLVLFASDNGPSDEGGGDVAFFEATGPFRGGKRDLSEGGLRVPMIAYGPGLVAPGAVVREAVAFWDVLPTLADLAGAPPTADADGVSIAPLLRGAPQDLSERCLYWRYRPDETLLQAARIGQWKAVRSGHGRLRLYDLAADPGEMRDMARRNPSIAARLAACMAQSEEKSS